MHHCRLWPVRCEDTREIIASYPRYMQSNHWKRVKVLFKHSLHYKGRCYVCGSTDKLEIHHKTYERIGHEDLSDLQELCELCHSLAHQLAQTGPEMGVTIGNAADAMLGGDWRNQHQYAPGGRERFHNTSRKQQKRNEHKCKQLGEPIKTPEPAPKRTATPGARIVQRRKFKINGSTSEMDCPRHGSVNTVGDAKGRRCCPECGTVLRK